ncbi:M4 family metallopeptidase [Acanthopleuribacter pedis]|uniref:M4 family metallopeptidase n=1 Tax=Acanthopleuribacter pedis TaxID=442870 RepID=A0A8J7QJL6_9BACT|nr:M4 family metallopeptidase [Acanthopleuribacter pedis]MBO1322076.1 M4 family metallopeptidase [Acanthopleuribacter pedis]
MGKMYRLWIAAILVVASLSVGPLAAADLPNQRAELRQKLSSSLSNIQRARYDEHRGTLRTLAVQNLVNGTGLVGKHAAGTNPEVLAKTFLDQYAPLVGAHADYRDLHKTAVKSDSLGLTRLSYEQKHGEVPVYGSVLHFYSDSSGRLLRVQGNLLPLDGVPAQAQITADQAAARALADVIARFPELNEADLTMDTPELVVHDTGRGAPYAGRIVLAWRVPMKRGFLTVESVFVEAVKGNVVDQVNETHTLAREVYQTNVNTDGLVWQEGNAQPYAGVDAPAINELIAASAETYNFFASLTNGEFLSWDGQDSPMRSLYNPANGGCPNAFWGNGTAAFCEGFATDDVIGHEFAHGYVEGNGDLIYRWQSGAMNESYADVFGEFIDLLNDRDVNGGNALRTQDALSQYVTPGPELFVEIAGGETRTFRAGGASFGAAPTIAGASGTIVLVEDTTANPNQGCETLANGAAVAGNIALIDRGECFFSEKAANAQAAGAIAVVIVNVQGNEVVNMSGDDSANPVTIPVISVGLADGNFIKAALAEGVTGSVQAAQAEVEDSARWVVGEDIGGGAGMRDMWVPNAGNDPATLTDPIYMCGPVDVDNGGVHINSGVGNRNASLLVDGGTVNGVTIPALGITKVAHIYFRALSQYLVFDSDYRDNADALEQAARDLVGVPLNQISLTSEWPGPGESVITEQDVAAVMAAVAYSEMRELPESCNFAPNLIAAAPALCTEGSSRTLFADDFEGDVTAWTLTHEGIFESFTERDWSIVSELPAGRNGKGFFAPDVGLLNNCGVGVNDETGRLMLASPAIDIADASNLRLAFEHYFSTERDFDGGNVKISIDGGDFQLIPADAFLYNGYTGPFQIDNNSNPLNNQPGFHGTNDGTNRGGTWGTSVVDLTGLVTGPASIQIRFDFGTDVCLGNDGWYIDSVRVFRCSSSSIVHADSNRWVPHLTSATGGFTTSLQMLNTDSTAQTVTLQPYASNGDPIGAVSIELAAGEQRTVNAGTLLGAEAGQVSLVADATVIVSAAYRIAEGAGASAHVRESQAMGRVFEVLPGEQDVVFDGMALINRGTESARIQVQTLNAAGEVIETFEVNTALAPFAKQLAVFDTYISEDTVRVRVISSQDATALFLRGTRVGVNPGYLFEVQPLVITP